MCVITIVPTVWEDSTFKEFYYCPHPKDGKVLFSQVFVCPWGVPIVSGPMSLPRSQVFLWRVTQWFLVPGPLPGLWSQVLSESTPILAKGYPYPGQGVPQSRTGGTLRQDRLHHHHTEPGWLCGAGGMPLAFTQEDFLVTIECQNKINRDCMCYVISRRGCWFTSTHSSFHLPHLSTSFLGGASKDDLTSWKQYPGVNWNDGRWS